MNRDDVILYFLGCAPSSVDPIRVMKAIFIFSQEDRPHAFPETDWPPFQFKAMQYGPCAPTIYCVLDTLSQKGYVQPLKVEGETWVKYKLTPNGRSRLAALEKDASTGPTRERLRTLRSWADSKTFSQLLREVYRAYPEYAVNSVLPHLGQS